jgi:hypothetical protein
MKRELDKRVSKRGGVLFILMMTTLAGAFLNFILRVEAANFTMVFLILTLMFIAWTEYLKLETNSAIKKNQLELDAFIANPSNIHNISYSYDDKEIQYFESEELKDIFQWSDLYHGIFDQKYYMLFFKAPIRNIVIPRAMVDETDLGASVIFENTAKEKIEKMNREKL